jgi:hypothetical protein
MKEHSAEATPHEAIRQHIEGAQDWEWRHIATTLYQWTDRLNDRFFTQKIPAALLSFERMDHRVLAAYTLNRNPQGLLYEITFNTLHLDRPLWEMLETLMHEYVHLWQQNRGEHPVTRNYHNREFVDRCEALGLHPAIGTGVHTRPADGPFAAFLKAYAVSQPDYGTDTIVDGKGRPLDWWYMPGKKEDQGSSTLRKWSCGCQNVRVGTKEFYASCTRCGHAFVKVEASSPLFGRQGRLPEMSADVEASPPDSRKVNEPPTELWPRRQT